MFCYTCIKKNIAIVKCFRFQIRRVWETLNIFSGIVIFSSHQELFCLFEISKIACKLKVSTENKNLIIFENEKTITGHTNQFKSTNNWESKLNWQHKADTGTIRKQHWVAYLLFFIEGKTCNIFNKLEIKIFCYFNSMRNFMKNLRLHQILYSALHQNQCLVTGVLQVSLRPFFNMPEYDFTSAWAIIRKYDSIDLNAWKWF